MARPRQNGEFLSWANKGNTVANRFFSNIGKFYAPHVFPVMIDCNFVVQSADSGGLGITGLKGPGVSAVYMKTSGTPPSGAPGGTTGPETGAIVVRLSDNYNRFFAMDFSVVAPKSGSDIKVDNSAMTIGAMYVITTLGNSTVAQWNTLGVPAGVVPAVGVSFIASLTGIAGQANTSTSKVQIAASTGSAVASVELIGDPNLSIAPAASANQGYGAQLIVQCRDYAGALVAPANNSVISLKFYLSNSSVLVSGEG